MRARSSTRDLLVVAVLAVVLRSDVAAGACVPCPLDAPPDWCSYQCCIQMSCSSPAGVGCLAFCGYGYVLVKIFGDGDGFTPAFKSFPGQMQIACTGRNRVGLIRPPTKRGIAVLSVGLHDITQRRFTRSPQGALSGTFFFAPLSEFLQTVARPTWTRIGQGTFDAPSGEWQVRWDTSGLSGGDYVVRADVLFGSADLEQTLSIARLREK